MKTLLIMLLILLAVFVSYSQEAVTIIEQHAGVIYVHSLSTSNFETIKSINPRLGLQVRFPSSVGSLYTRVVYDIPNQAFGHIIWDVPIQEHGWSGIHVLTGYQPRLTSLIQPSPLSIDGQNRTSAMSAAPGATYALRLQVSDSLSENTKFRSFAGVYHDEGNKLGLEMASQLFIGSTKVGLTEFVDSRVIGTALFFDSPDATGFCMVRANKEWVAQDYAASFQVKGTMVGDPYVDMVYSVELNQRIAAEVGTFTNINLPDMHKAQLGLGYNLTDEMVKGYIALYW